jgi:ADP-heptose:LPS heptosyltransferase
VKATIEPKVFFCESDVATAKGLLSVANPEGRPVVVMVTQNSGGQSTGWRMDRFVEVIRSATERGLAVVYVGTAADAAAIEGIRVAAGGAGSSIAGKTTVNELAAVLAASDYAVSLDTGTMHVGRAVDVPMVVLGPSWQKPLEWMPLGIDRVRILRGEDRSGAPEGYRLDEISAASVRETLSELVAIYPANEEARAERLQAGISTIDHLADR